MITVHRKNDFATVFIDSLGPEYGEACILDLEKTWEESEPQTPLVCILSIGSDPSPQITALAKSKDIRMQMQFILQKLTIYTSLTNLLSF